MEAVQPLIQLVESIQAPSSPLPKRWQFGLTVLVTEEQATLIQTGLEELFEAAGYIGLAAGAQIDVTRREVQMESVECVHEVRK